MDFYETLYGKCQNCTFSVITLPDKGVRHFETIASMREEIGRVGDSRNTYIHPWPRRIGIKDGVRGDSADTTYATCLFADIDIKSEAHREQMLPASRAEVLSFLDAFPLKATFTVFTGHGIHAYWLFDAPIHLTDANRDKMEKLLAGFGRCLMKKAKDERGWRIDPVFDPARMLRAVGSMNLKIGEKIPCEVIVENEAFYKPEDFHAYVLDAPKPRTEEFHVDERVMGSAERIMEGCVALKQMTEQPDNVSEPLWHALCTNVALAKDGEEKFQEWSSLYSHYSPMETQYKLRSARNANKPCTCRYIKDCGLFPCPDGGCGVKAPIVLALYTKFEQLEIILGKDTLSAEELLDPYVVGLLPYAKENCPAEYSRLKLAAKKAGIGMRDFDRITKKEEEKRDVGIPFDAEPEEIKLKGIDLHGAMTPKGYRITMENGVESFYFDEGALVSSNLCPEPLVIERRMENIDNGTERFELAYHRSRKWKRLMVSRAIALNKSSVVRLADNGVPVSTDNADGVVHYLSRYEAENDKQIPFVRSIGRIGWLGEKEFYPYILESPVEYEDKDDAAMIAALKEQGSFETWLKFARELREQTYARAILAASFASVLLEKLKRRVAIIHIWHSSRSGKTAALKFALSVWGDPMKLMGNFNSTAVGLERRAGTLRHLPLGLDELQVLNERRLSPSMVVYSLGNGYGKTRGAKAGGLQEVPVWRNAIISTGEQPLTNEATMDGVHSRVLELYGQPISDADFGRKVHQVSENHYGFAGKVYLEHIVDTDLSDEFEEIRESIGDGDQGVHLDTVALLALADYHAGISVFGETKRKAWKDAISFGKRILTNAKENEPEDVVDRAYDFVTDWIAANRKRFAQDAIPCLGKIEPGKVLVIATELRRALEDNGFSYTKCRKGFRDRGYVDTFEDSQGKSRSQYLRNIQGVNVRVFCFPIQVENIYPPDEDFLT